MGHTLFSIIIPTFNSSLTLRACLDSIAGQTFKNYEVIIMDGLSEDNTIQLANNYRSSLPNLRVISEKDYGIYDAMNKSIKIAKGSWLYFMGSDDFFYDRGVLENIY